jgi:hypothetical protein
MIKKQSVSDHFSREKDGSARSQFYLPGLAHIRFRTQHKKSYQVYATEFIS